MSSLAESYPTLAIERPVEHGPEAVRGLRAGANYAKLDADGLVAVGARDVGDICAADGCRDRIAKPVAGDLHGSGGSNPPRW